MQGLNVARPGPPRGSGPARSGRFTQALRIATTLHRYQSLYVWDMSLTCGKLGERIMRRPKGSISTIKVTNDALDARMHTRNIFTIECSVHDEIATLVYHYESSGDLSFPRKVHADACSPSDPWRSCQTGSAPRRGVADRPALQASLVHLP